jgi:hypothetical protein
VAFPVAVAKEPLDAGGDHSVQAFSVAKALEAFAVAEGVQLVAVVELS